VLFVTENIDRYRGSCWVQCREELKPTGWILALKILLVLY